ncbi:MAG: radical SAM protein, partial [Candidatus Latescibacteria bacterium]|nr:radical SAM protein [Candidatus Latescibacterota bacterium]
MHLTVDIRIAGCAARCWHCYVNGGPGPLMPLEEYRCCLDTLEVVFDGLKKHGVKIDLCLDYEPLLHPDICEILKITAERFEHHFVWSTFPTTGIPIATRPDWEEILETLRDVGFSEIM